MTMDKLVSEIKTIASLGKLNLSTGNTSATAALPSNDDCIAHLRFLTVLANVREDISERDGLFGISDASAAAVSTGENNKVLTKIREKRWSVYV